MEKEKHLGLRIDAETHKKLKSLAENLHIWIQEKPVRLYGTGKFYLARKLLCISSGIL